MKRTIPVLSIACCIATAPALCSDQGVKDALAEADKFALQEKYIPDEQTAKAHCSQTIKQINAIIDKLQEPSQLVELISVCNEKISQIPSDSKHEPYFNYFIFVQEFAIGRLGKMQTPEAKEALDQVHQAITGKAHLSEVWDEAKIQQDKAPIAR